jgi:hypothetical protein
MSIAKLGTIQLGDNADPNKNFVLMVPDVRDGSLEIRRGNWEAPGSLLMKIHPDNGISLNQPIFIAYLNQASMPLNHNTQTQVQIVEEYDSHNFFANYLFNPKIAGWYEIEAVVTIAATAVGQWSMASIYKGNVNNSIGTFTEHRRIGRHYSAGANSVTMSRTTKIYFNGSTDAIALFAQQENASAAQTSALGNNAAGSTIILTGMSGSLWKAGVP